MIIEIPSKDNRLFQANRGEFSGNIWASKNLDLLSNPGAIRVSPQTVMRMTNDSNFQYYDEDFAYPSVLLRTTADDGTGMGLFRYWALCDGYLYKTVSDSPIPSGTNDWQKAGNSAPTTGVSYLYSDMVEFNGSLIVSLLTSVSKNTAGTWTANVITGLTTDVPHPLCVGFNNLLAVGNGNLVWFYDTSFSQQHIITLDTEYQVQWIRSSNSTYYIGCKSKNGGRAKVFTWNGANQNFDGDYKINGSECYCGVIKDEVCHTINELGELLVFSGGGFTQKAVLPIFNTGYVLPAGAVNKKGMVVLNDDIYISLNIGGLTNAMENMLSGIWCFNENIGLHHKYSVSADSGANVIDYGVSYISKAGGLLVLDRSLGGLLISTTAYIDVSTPIHIIATLENIESDSIEKVGYFTTPKILTESIEENWQKMWAVIKNFVNSTSKIILKYRTEDKIYLLAGWNSGVSCTWATDTSFTTSYVTSELNVGDEIEIVSGEGAGLCAHIVSITGTSTKTITIDETVAGSSGTLLVRASNWTKCLEINSTNTIRRAERALSGQTTWLQIKCVMFFKGKEEMKKLVIKSNPQIEAK